jgi:hypothetical protein
MKAITLITLGLSVAACSSSTSPPTEADYEDTAQAIASSTATAGRGGGIGGGEILAMTDAVSIARGRLPLGFLRLGDGRCHGNRMGVEHTFTATCKDAAGTVQEQCDKTTDSATVELTLTGSFETSNVTASVDRQAAWTITGLQSETATFGGTSSLSLETTMTSVFHEGVTSSFTFDADASYDAIQIATEERDIIGGSASLDVTAHRVVTGTEMGAKDVDRTFEIHAVITFNADQTATLVLDGTQTFTIDLDSGKLHHRGR